MTLRKIGGLWLREGKSGKFMSGEIKLSEDDEKINFMVFKNDKGDNPKRPDYNIMLKDDDEPPVADRQPFNPVTDSEIPF